MGVHHGLAQIVGARTGMPHGLANAVILAHALRFNASAVPTEAYRIGTALGDPDDPAGAVDRLRQRVGLPAGLSECGMDDDDLDAAVHLAADNRNVAANVRPVSPEDARSILEAAW
jgi:alcohol dehydrogenase